MVIRQILLTQMCCEETILSPKMYLLIPTLRPAQNHSIYNLNPGSPGRVVSFTSTGATYDRVGF